MCKSDIPAAARPHLLLCLGGALLLACSGGDDDGNVNGDEMAPSVEVAFPPPVSLTDASTVTIRGRASDPDGIVAVRVNGQLADTQNAFAEWQTTLTLSHGSNIAVIESEDSLGFIDEQAARIDVMQSANWFEVPTAVATDPVNNRALVLDRVLDALLSVNYATGERVIVSAEDVGSGPRLLDPNAVFYDANGDRALVVDMQLAALLSVDLSTGDRTVLSDGSTGTGPAFDGPWSLTADIAMNRAWVLDIDATDPLNPVPVIVSIDLSTGDRAIVEAPNTGIRPTLTAPTSLAVDATNQRLFVADDDVTDPMMPMAAIFAVDVATAEMTLLSRDGPFALEEPYALSYDPEVAAEQLFVLDRGADAVFAVDVTTGDRTVVSIDGVSTGQDFSVPAAMAIERVDATTTRALVIDTGLDELLAVDMDSGARSVVSDVSIGSGPALVRPVALVVDAAGDSIGRALVVDRQNEAIISVDLATGVRTMVSNDETGDGTPFDDPVALSLDVPVGLYGQEQAASRVFVIDEAAASIVSVNLANGVRTELSGPGAGTGTQFGSPRAVTLIPGDMDAGTVDRLMVADDSLGAIVSVDLASGVRTVLTDGGGGPALEAPQALTPEMDMVGYTGRLLVADRDLASLLAVDIDGGTRTPISGQGVGDGAPFDDPISVQMELAPVPPQDPPVEVGEDELPPPTYMPTGYALVVHSGSGSLLAVELSTGRRTALNNTEELGLGPQLDNPEAMVHDPANERMIVVDSGLESVMMVDSRTNQRVLISR